MNHTVQAEYIMIAGDLNERGPFIPGVKFLPLTEMVLIKEKLLEAVDKRGNYQTFQAETYEWGIESY